jgi:hypothetical protein
MNALLGISITMSDCPYKTSSNLYYTLKFNKKLTVHCYILGDVEVFVESVLADVNPFMLSVYILQKRKNILLLFSSD